MTVIVGTQLPMITVMSSFHLYLNTITHDHSHVKLPFPSPHNYPQSKLCQASISISTIALIVGNCVEMEMEA
jgi:hypothetical protein